MLNLVLVKQILVNKLLQPSRECQFLSCFRHSVADAIDHSHSIESIIGKSCSPRELFLTKEICGLTDLLNQFFNSRLLVLIQQIHVHHKTQPCQGMTSKSTSGSSPHLDIDRYRWIRKDIHGYEKISLGYLLVNLEIVLDLSKKSYPLTTSRYPGILVELLANTWILEYMFCCKPFSSIILV
jgi:hypothetical protein